MGTSERTCNLLYRLAQSKADSVSRFVKTESMSVKWAVSTAYQLWPILGLSLGWSVRWRLRACNRG